MGAEFSCGEQFSIRFNNLHQDLQQKILSFWQPKCRECYPKETLGMPMKDLLVKSENKWRKMLTQYCIIVHKPSMALTIIAIISCHSSEKRLSTLGIISLILKNSRNTLQREMVQSAENISSRMWRNVHHLSAIQSLEGYSKVTHFVILMLSVTATQYHFYIPWTSLSRVILRCHVSPLKLRVL